MDEQRREELAMEKLTMEKLTFAQSLRAIADWYDAHPEIEPPLHAVSVAISETDSHEHALALAKALAPCRKEYSDTLLVLSRVFGQIEMRHVFYRSAVCERVVLGKESVPERIIPAHEREIVEWECHPLLASESQVLAHAVGEMADGKDDAA
jgi:hypothetical protein